jgi:hypothetical protein
MTTAEWVLNCALLGWVLLRNTGTRPVTRSTFTVPLLIVAVAAVVYLRNIPGVGHDHALELLGVLAGVVFGLAATASTRVTPSGSGGAVARAGVAFAAVWVVAIGGRIAFAELATHSWGPAVARFSVAHEITGADAWRAAFVLMALAMVVTRVATTAVRARRCRTGLAPQVVLDAPPA